MSDSHCQPAALEKIRHPAHGPSAKQVSPAVPLAKSVVAPLGRKLTVSARQFIGASVSATAAVNRAFRGFGLAILAILAVCIAWTTFLIVLTLRPNETANWLMDTGKFDDGQFWLIVDADSDLLIVSVAALVVVDICFLHVLAKMTLWRQAPSAASKDGSLKSRAIRWVLSIPQRLVPESRRHIVVLWSGHISTSWHELTHISGRNRKFWNVAMKCVDLGMQSSQLYQTLEAGFPIVLVRGYAIFLASNAVSVSTTIVLAHTSAMTEIIVDSIFDLIAAVGYSIWILVYCYTTFDIDRRAFQLNAEVLPLGSFERMTRMQTNSQEATLFRTCFDLLGFQSFLILFVRVGMNLTLYRRFHMVADALLHTDVFVLSTKSTRQSTRQVTAVHPSSLVPVSKRARPQRRVPKLLAALFVAFAAAVIVYTEKSVASSHAVCSTYPQCVVYAYRWRENDTCPCLALVDAYRTPLTLKEWMYPIDVTPVVRTLAASGDLRILQVINRGLLQLSEELRNCSALQYLSLMYTGLEAVPPWVSEFRALIYLHLEGKELFTNLVTMDDGLFSDMPHLTYLHVAVHDNLREFPALNGVPNLRSLVLAKMLSLQHVPAFHNTPNLRRLELIYLPQVRTLTNLPRATQLVHLAVFRRCAFCCNGFLGECDPTNSMCAANPQINISQVECLGPDDPRASEAILSVAQHFPFSFCLQSKSDLINSTDVINREIIEMCDGVPYRRCEYPAGSGRVGMCYNNRMQVLACLLDDNYIRLRRAQIADRIGPVCNPVEEAWLGCT